LDLVHPEDVVRTLNFIKDERIKGKVNEIENRYLTKDGQFKKIHWTVKAGYAKYMYAIAKVVKE